MTTVGIVSLAIIGYALVGALAWGIARSRLGDSEDEAFDAGVVAVFWPVACAAWLFIAGILRPWIHRILVPLAEWSRKTFAPKNAP